MEVTIEYPTVDLTKQKLVRVDDLVAARTTIYAEINRWLVNQGPHAYTIPSILMNKLVYYIGNEVKKVNPDFTLNTGWYMYGPCFEEGRRFEFDQEYMTIKPVAKEISQEVKVVCDELIPLFNECNEKGTVLTEFLRHIYANKCDQTDFQDFYLAKHDMLCILYRFRGTEHEIGREVPSEIHEKEMNFEKLFYKGNYKDIVELSTDEVENITDFVDLMIEYLNIQMELKRSAPDRLIEDIFNVNKNILLAGLSHLNYSKTFVSFNQTYQNTLRREHAKRGHRILGDLGEENRRISKSIFELSYRGS